ncbi:MAG: hypothetical protein ABEI98_01570 [Halorhabdus sp.]
MAYLLWAGELAISGTLILAGFDVGLPGPDDVPGLGNDKWLVPPQEWFGPIDVPGRLAEILGNVGTSIGAPILDFVSEFNTTISTMAGSASPVPAIVQPVVVTGLWGLEILAILFVLSRSLGLVKTLALDTLNPL